MSEDKDHAENLGPSSDCDACSGNGGWWNDESQDDWHWCQHCDAVEKHAEQARAICENRERRGRMMDWQTAKQVDEMRLEEIASLRQRIDQLEREKRGIGPEDQYA